MQLIMSLRAIMGYKGRTALVATSLRYHVSFCKDAKSDKSRGCKNERSVKKVSTDVGRASTSTCQHWKTGSMDLIAQVMAITVAILIH